MNNKYIGLEKRIGKTYLFRVLDNDRSLDNPYLIDVGEKNDDYNIVSETMFGREQSGKKISFRWTKQRAKIILPNPGNNKKIEIKIVAKSFFQNFCTAIINNRRAGSFLISDLQSYKPYTIKARPLSESIINLELDCAVKSLPTRPFFNQKTKDCSE